MRLVVKLSVAFLCAFAVAMALTILLNQSKFGDILRGLDDSRMSVMTLDVSRRLRQAVDLGLPLKDIAESRAIVDSLIDDNPELQSVSIFDATGALVAHGGEPLGDGGTTAPDAWVVGNRAAGGEVWRQETAESFLVGAPVVNNFGKLEGGVAVRYGKARYTAIVTGLTGALLEAAVVIFLVAGLAAVLGAILALRRLTVTARRLRRAVEALPEGTAEANPELPEFEDYSASVREIDAALQAAERGVS